MQYLYGYLNYYIIGVFLILGLKIFSSFQIWYFFKARMLGAKLKFFTFLNLKFLKIPHDLIIPPLINAHNAGLTEITLEKLISHYLGGGNIQSLVYSWSTIRRNSKLDLDLGFNNLSLDLVSAIDISGRDFQTIIRDLVNTRVIETPVIEVTPIDGIQLLLQVTITTRPSLDTKRLLGGAGRETIIARVSQGIISFVGSAENHRMVISNPQK